MFDNLFENEDAPKIFGMIIAVVMMVVINKLVKKCSQKLLDKYKPGSTNFRIGIVGDIRGKEIKAKKVIDGCLNTFVKIGGNVMKTNVMLKISQNKELVTLVKELAEKYKIQIIGIKFGDKHYMEDDECEAIIEVEDYKQYGDESRTFFKNIDQLIYLQGEHEDKLSEVEYRAFKDGKIHYDLNQLEFTKPVAHENMI